MRDDADAARGLLVGTLYTLAAFVTWGLLPLYWKLLSDVSAPVILAHRIIWSFAFVSAVLLVLGRFRPMMFLRDPSRRRAVFLTAALIAVNWFTYIWAVSTEQLVEASMGYYINPLFSVFLGLVILKERLSRLEAAALILAAIGVANIALRYGRIPWIALLLTASFGFYGLLKKLVAVDSLTALSLETAILSPFAVFYLAGVVAWAEPAAATAAAGDGGLTATGLAALAPAFGGGSGDGGFATVVLLLFAGVVTAMPLYWFAKGAQRIPLSQVGFMQYIAPSLMLLIGVFLFGEAFTAVHAVSFAFIWAGLALYSISRFGAHRNRRETARREARRVAAEPDSS